MGYEIEITGLDHIYLTVSDMAVSEPFYDSIFRLLGFKKGDARVGDEPHCHYYNRSLQISIRPAHSEASHDPYAPGLHHVCLQVASKGGVDAVYRVLTNLGVEARQPALYKEYDPDYYATFFEDPDGIRFEVVGRVARRDRISMHWAELTEFLNPLTQLG